jgi:hypothetical protein
MGFTDFARGRRYKIIVAVISAVGFVFLIMGAAFTAAGATSTTPATGLTPSASGLRHDGGIQYTWDIYQKHTIINITSHPAISTSPIRWNDTQRTGGAVSINPTSENGSIAVLTINRFDYWQSPEDDNNIQIAAESGNAGITIRIRIFLPREFTEVRAQLHRTTSPEGSTFGATGGTTLHLSSLLARHDYRLAVSFHVHGQEVSINQSSIDFVEYNRVPSHIVIWGLDKIHLPNSPDIQGQYTFKITLNYLGGQYFTFFTLTIID